MYIHTYTPMRSIFAAMASARRGGGVEATPSPPAPTRPTKRRHAIVSSSVGPEYYVSVMSFVNQDLLEPGCSVLLHNKVMGVVGILSDDTDPMVSVMKVDKAPLESYADIGGLETQIQEIKEAVELPLAHPELYEEVGIKPPKGVILYGVPGTGKTLLAKAVANQTSATFLRVVGSELIQATEMVEARGELFRVADDLSPTIVFIDEIDAVGSKRYDSQSEVLGRSKGRCSSCSINWTLREREMESHLATNKIESLDPALISLVGLIANSFWQPTSRRSAHFTITGAVPRGRCRLGDVVWPRTSCPVLILKRCARRLVYWR